MKRHEKLGTLERHPPTTRSLIYLALLSALLLSSCQGQTLTRAVPEVLATYPHDPQAFTQGLLLADGLFYESTGLYGASTLREVVPETGEVLRQYRLPREYFAEGLELVDDRLIQLTWKEEVALVYRRDTFEQIDTLTYEGDGWGLCYDGEALIMSDGSATLTHRDPETFAVLGTTQVTLSGRPLEALNELECVEGFVYANVWQEDLIVKIDADGRVVQEIDASSLLSPAERARLGQNAVLNGIAYNPETETFFITGKLWPQLFEVRFTEAER
jgi:glutaminyl-peptide cyclotransferase